MFRRKREFKSPVHCKLSKKTSERRWSVRLKQPYHITVTAMCTIQNYQIAEDVDDSMTLAWDSSETMSFMSINKRN